MLHTLEQYVAQHNSWNKIFDKAHVDIDIDTMSKLQADDLIRKLDSEMSPENLHCDGELTHSQAQDKYDHLMAVWQDLRSVYYKKQWTLPPVYDLA
jgi:hypothetical protein